MKPQTSESVEEQLRSIVAARLRISSSAVSMDASIIDELGLDSIEVMQCLLEVENRFPWFRIASTSDSECKTLRELARRLESGPEPFST